MNIFTRILSTTLPLVFFILSVSVGTTYYFSRQALTELAETWLETRMAEAMKIATGQEDMLRQYGLEDIAASVKMAKLDAGTAMTAIKVGDRGYIMAITAQGTIVVHPDPDRIGKDIHHSQWFQRLRPGKGRVAYPDGDGPLLAMYDYFKPWGWYILAADPEAEVYGATNHMKPWVLAIGIVGSLVMTATLMALTRRLTAPLRSLTHGAERIGRGDLNTRIDVASQDEFGRLSCVFNHMAAQLQESLTALKHSEEHFRALIEKATDIITILDVGGKISYISPSVTRALGMASEKLIGQNVLDYIHPDDRDDCLRLIQQRAATAGQTPTSELRFKGRDGTWHTLESISSNLLDHPAVKGIVVNSRDITKRKQVEAALQRSYQELEQRVADRTSELFETNQRLRCEIDERTKVGREKDRLQAQLYKAQKMEAIGTLAGGIAHDFNNILMGLQGNISIMRTASDTPSGCAKRLAVMEDYVNSGASLTKQLLGFARLGKYEVKLTNINNLIGKSAEMFGRTRKELHIFQHFDPDSNSVMVDRGQIEQVLLNLFINAWQSMPDGGELHLATANVFIGPEDAKNRNVDPGRFVKISVTDTGIGMDPEIKDRIFDPFFTTKNMKRGTGLGLASAYGIVRNHGGLIDVHSQKGQGTTFNIYLPASHQRAECIKTTTHEPLNGNETLLFVDDEPLILEVGREMLEALGYHVLVAGSGKEAIDTFEKNCDRIDLVLLDMIMPDMGGGETFDRIKEINEDTKVLLASGYSINGQASEILERGCNGFIQKPFNLPTLSQELRKILDAAD